MVSILDLDLQNLPELKCERLVCSFSGSESSGLLRESPISGLGHVSIAASSAILKWMLLAFVYVLKRFCCCLFFFFFLSLSVDCFFGYFWFLFRFWLFGFSLLKANIYLYVLCDFGADQIRSDQTRAIATDRTSKQTRRMLLSAVAPLNLHLEVCMGQPSVVGCLARRWWLIDWLVDYWLIECGILQSFRLFRL